MKVCDYRLISCEYCELQVSSILIPSHTNICPRMKLNCPLNCGVTVERKDIEEHSKSFCDNATVQCMYYTYECEYKGPKKTIFGHSTSSAGEHGLLVLKFVEGFNKQYFEKIFFYESNGKKLLEDVIEMEEEEKMMILKEKEQLELNEKREKEQKEKEEKEKEEREKEEREKEEQKNLLNQKREREEINDDFIFYEAINLESSNNHTSDEEIGQINPEKEVNSIKEIGITKEKEIWNFNKSFSSSCLLIENNKVTCHTTAKNQHMFAFIDRELNYKSASWKVTINKYSIWIGFGLCDRSRIISNKYVFTNPGNLFFNNGCFILSSNFFLWNPNNPSENNKMVKKQKMEYGDTIYMEYNHFNHELAFSVGDSFYRLTNVKSNNPLVPCVILLNYGDEAVVDFLK